MEIILATLREQGRSQRWLAGKLGIHESYIPKYRAGVLTPSDDLLRHAASLLGLPEMVVLSSPDSPIGEVPEFVTEAA